MDDHSEKRKSIIDVLEGKYTLKQQIYSNTMKQFAILKEVLHEMSGEINDQLQNPRLIKVEYRDRGKFEAQIQVATDMLIFSMHSNVFEFNRDHIVFNNDYVKSDIKNSYCGVINIYNFLSDSFKYNRQEDFGYLIARVFINHENKFFVEGKRQNKFDWNTFGNNILTKDNLIEVVETAILYCAEFDLLIPPYDNVKIVAVEQLNTKIENSRIQTGKRLGYNFSSDDV